MNFDMEKVLQSKNAMRRALASRSLSEKLAMLDALRERTLSLRAATPDDGLSLIEPHLVARESVAAAPPPKS